MDKYQYKHISANGTFVIHSRAASLIRVTMNTAGATGNILTLYNNTAGSGDVIAVIDTTRSSIPQLEYGIQCPAGLTAVLSTGTAADLTIVSEGPGA